MLSDTDGLIDGVEHFMIGAKAGALYKLKPLTEFVDRDETKILLDRSSEVLVMRVARALTDSC